jgi:hypothetical protein
MGVKARFSEKQITLTYPTQKWASINNVLSKHSPWSLILLEKTRPEVGFDDPAWPASLV